VAWFAGLGLAKTTSVARFFFLRVVFGRGGGGLGSSPAHGVGGGGRIAMTARRHELFGARTPTKRWSG